MQLTNNVINKSFELSIKGLYRCDLHKASIMDKNIICFNIHFPLT